MMKGVTFVTRTPDSWFTQAREWGINPALLTPDSIHRIVQYHLHKEIDRSKISLQQFLDRPSNTPDPLPVTCPKTPLVAASSEKGVNLCAKCMGKVTEIVEQSRSADEGSTVSYHCPQCNKKTSLYNPHGGSPQDDEPEEIPPRIR